MISRQSNADQYEEELRLRAEKYIQENGLKDRLKAQLRNKLLESTWKIQLEKKCQELIKSKGVQNVTVEQLTRDVLPFAADSVPENIKLELTAQLKEIVEKIIP